MRFMLIRKADAETEAGVLPTPEFMAAMQRYNDKLARAGVFLDGVGLRASSMGAKVKVNGGAPTVTDGPFTETKELIAGYTLIEVRSREEAIAWARRWPAIDADAEIEVRQLFEPEDFVRAGVLPVKITVETLVRAPIADVWGAWTTPHDITKWNAASDDWHTTTATVDLREGGAFSSRMEARDGSIGFDFAGTYTRVVPEQLLEFTFGDRAASVMFVEGPNGVTVRETFDAESDNSIEQQGQGWQAILDRFARYVEANQ